ncbi:Uncharacterised protein [Corynebacterium amycolatum]|nr:Uncharacterised protein [Corynebacterium amycolatum]
MRTNPQPLALVAVIGWKSIRGNENQSPAVSEATATPAEVYQGK